MSSKNKQLLAIFSFILLAGYLSVGVALYQYTHKYAEDQNKKKLDQILLNQRALHTYLEDTLKPVVYQLKKEGKLYNGFFDPKILSFTYIARGIHKELNTLRSENNISQIYYKLATDNPRNQLNQGNADEIKILNRFRENPSLKDYSKIITENGSHYIYYAMPVDANKESCMKCHSTPDKAPSELLSLYGTTAGFGETVGTVRAMISLKMPFDDELYEANQIFILIMSILTLFLLLLYGVVHYFLGRLDESQQIIEEKNKSLLILSEHDSLTNAYNRRSFDSDLERQIGDSTLILIIFDIDYFKRINDTYGHQAGDVVLVKLAELVRSNLRESDLLYRIGGEEFAIISHGQDLEDAKMVISRLLKMISEYDFDLPENIHISAGLALNNQGNSAPELYKRADNALYKAKDEGRNRFVAAD